MQANTKQMRANTKQLLANSKQILPSTKQLQANTNEKQATPSLQAAPSKETNTTCASYAHLCAKTSWSRARGGAVEVAPALHLL